MRAAACLLSAGLIAASLAACGGSSGSGSSTSPAPGATTGSTAPAAPAEANARAGRAAPFVEGTSDNSIPTYGAEASKSQRAEAQAALRSYLRARGEGAWGRSCRYLAATVRQQLVRFAGGKPCPVAYAVLAGYEPASERANPLRGPLLSLRQKGDSGFALFYGPHKQKYVMPMAREGAAWRVAQLAPIAYPLGSVAMSGP